MYANICWGILSMRKRFGRVTVNGVVRRILLLTMHLCNSFIDTLGCIVFFFVCQFVLFGDSFLTILAPQREFLA